MLTRYLFFIATLFISTQSFSTPTPKFLQQFSELNRKVNIAQKRMDDFEKIHGDNNLSEAESIISGQNYCLVLKAKNDIYEFFIAHPNEFYQFSGSEVSQLNAEFEKNKADYVKLHDALRPTKFKCE